MSLYFVSQTLYPRFSFYFRVTVLQREVVDKKLELTARVNQLHKMFMRCGEYTTVGENIVLFEIKGE